MRKEALLFVIGSLLAIGWMGLIPSRSGAG
jgi:hypothetical protein